MNQPSVDMLTHSGEHHTEEPAVTTSSAGVKQAAVVLFAFDGTFSTGASVGVKLPKVTVSGDACV